MGFGSGVRGFGGVVVGFRVAWGWKGGGLGFQRKTAGTRPLRFTEC